MPDFLLRSLKHCASMIEDFGYIYWLPYTLIGYTMQAFHQLYWSFFLVLVSWFLSGFLNVRLRLCRFDVYGRQNVI